MAPDDTSAGPVAVDRYVFDTLMADLVGHDRSAAAFLVYLFLWSRTRGAGARSTRASHNRIAEETGLSKSGVQAALRRLKRRKLVRSTSRSITDTPEHAVLRPWVRREASR